MCPAWALPGQGPRALLMGFCCFSYSNSLTPRRAFNPCWPTPSSSLEIRVLHRQKQ